MNKTLRLLLSLIAVLGLSAALAACGDDDDDAAEATTTTEAADDEATDEGEDEGFEGNPCAEGAAEEPADDGGEDAEGENTDAPAEEPSADATPVEVGVVEGDGTYGFSGGDELGEQGEYALTLNNTGEEAHMVFITRLDDSETRSVEEILALPEEEQEEIDSTDIAEAFACPGETSEAVAVNVDEPGRYVLLCFFPVGSTADAPELPDGPPHAARGMVKEITVS